ncbi:hypothetical protein [Syntrophotalea carbinolica]|nr:hypothetical protein [Syntrophotalea carbinolica]
MARKRKHDTAAECVAEHRKRKSDTHRRVEISLPIDAAEKLKRLATSEATTPSIIIERILADIPDPS